VNGTGELFSYLPDIQLRNSIPCVSKLAGDSAAFFKNILSYFLYRIFHPIKNSLPNVNSGVPHFFLSNCAKNDSVPSGSFS